MKLKKYHLLRHDGTTEVLMFTEEFAERVARNLNAGDHACYGLDCNDCGVLDKQKNMCRNEDLAKWETYKSIFINTAEDIDLPPTPDETDTGEMITEILEVLVKNDLTVLESFGVLDLTKVELMMQSKEEK